MSSSLYNADAKSVEVSSHEVSNPYGDGRKVNVSITVGNDYLHLDSVDREQLVKLIDGLEAAFHRIVNTDASEPATVYPVCEGCETADTVDGSHLCEACMSLLNE